MIERNDSSEVYDRESSRETTDVVRLGQVQTKLCNFVQMLLPPNLATFAACVGNIRTVRRTLVDVTEPVAFPTVRQSERLNGSPVRLVCVRILSAHIPCTSLSGSMFRKKD